MDKEWLKNLKIGDKVYVDKPSRYDSEIGWYVGIVHNITATGRIKVRHKSNENNIVEFDSDGIERINTAPRYNWGYVKSYLAEYTEELAAERQKVIYQQRLAKLISEYNFKSLTILQLEEIGKILNIN